MFLGVEVKTMFKTMIGELGRLWRMGGWGGGRSGRGGGS